MATLTSFWVTILGIVQYIISPWHLTPTSRSWLQYDPSEIAVWRQWRSVASDPVQWRSARNTGPLPGPNMETVVVVVTSAPMLCLVSSYSDCRHSRLAKSKFLTKFLVSKLTAYNSCIPLIPVTMIIIAWSGWITYCSPYSINAYFQSTFKWVHCWSNQPHITIRTVTEDNWAPHWKWTCM